MAPTASLPGSSQPKFAARVSASPPSPLESGTVGWLASGAGPAWFCTTSRAAAICYLACQASMSVPISTTVNRSVTGLISRPPVRVSL